MDSRSERIIVSGCRVRVAAWLDGVCILPLGDFGNCLGFSSIQQTQFLIIFVLGITLCTRVIVYLVTICCAAQSHLLAWSPF
jgi:hypothetical protein